MRKIAFYLMAAMAVALAWETWANHNGTVRLLVSSPSRMAEYFMQHWQLLLAAGGQTLVEAFLGLLIATFVATLSALVSVFVPSLLRWMLPMMILLQVVPLIVIAPILIIVLGTGPLAMVIMSAILAYFPIFINLANAIRHTDRNLIDFLTLNRASTWQKIFHGYRPACTPAFFAGLRVGATLAAIGAIVAEFSGVPTGLGRNLFVSAVRLEPDLLMCTVLLSAMLGYALYSLVVLWERMFVDWYEPGLGL